MSELAVNLALIELLKDVAKIGIPAASAVASGFLLPYFLEKFKSKAAAKKEFRDFSRKQIAEAIECLADFSGQLFSYIYICKSHHINRGVEEYDILQSNSSQDLVFNEVKLKKVRAIIGMLGHSSIADKLAQFDDQANETVRHVFPNLSSEASASLKKLKLKERDLFASLNQLLDSVQKK